MKDLIRKILKESEDEFEWAKEIVSNTNNLDISAGVIYHKFGLNENTKDTIFKKVCDELSGVEYINGRIILTTDSYCDFSDLFYESRRGSDGYIDQYLAKRILCDDDDDYWEPYQSSDLVPRREWKDTIWDDLVITDKEILDSVLSYIKNNYVSTTNYNPNQLDIEGNLPKKQNVIEINGKILDTEYFNYLSKNLNELGELISEEEDLEGIRYELLWAYGDAYNTAARDNVYKSTMDPIEENFGKGTWDSKQIQKMGGTVTRHFIKFDITDLFVNTISYFFDNCWANCHSNPNDISIEELEEECEECKNPSWEFSSFLNLYTFIIKENNEEYNPKYSEWPDNSTVEKYFKESVYNRI